MISKLTNNNFNIFLIISMLILVGCSKKTTTLTLYETINTLYKASDNIKKLNSVISENYIYSQHDTVYINRDTKILKYKNDKLLFMVGHTIYLTDISLHILDRIPLKLDGNISSIKKDDNNLFILDQFHGIKEFNIKTKELVKIKLQNKKYQSDNGNFFDLCFINGNIVITTPIFPNNRKEDVLIARVIDLKGNILSYIKIPSQKIDNSWNNVIDFTFCTSYNNKLYFSFVFSRSVYVYDVGNKLEAHYNFIVDNKIWSPAVFEKNPLSPVNTVISTQDIKIHNNMIYHIINSKAMKGPLLIIYNIKFVPLKLFKLDIKTSKIGYSLFFTENNFVIQSGNYIYTYENLFSD